MKKILSLIALVVGISTASAASYSTNNIASGTHDVLIGTPIVLTSFQATTTNTVVPTLIKLYDGYITITNTAYTNYTAARTAVTTTYITSTGVTNSYTNYVWKTTANPVAAGTVTQQPLLTLSLTAGAPINWPSDLGDNLPAIPFARWLRLTTDATGASLVATYRTP